MPALTFLSNFQALNPTYLLVVIIVLLVIWLIYMEWRLKRFMTGQSGASLEQHFATLARTVAATDETNEEIQQHLIKMEERLQKSVQHVRTVRFNPFTETGSNQSFATAFLDEHGDGAVISTLYSREKTSVFAKPIKGRASEFELTVEEKQALASEK